MERYGIFKGDSEELNKGNTYKVKISADGERAVRIRVLLLNRYFLYEDINAVTGDWDFYDHVDNISYILEMERYINKLQEELKERKRNGNVI